LSPVINKAYETLKTPILRAKYLCPGSYSVDKEFLARVYEMQDDIDEGIRLDLIRKTNLDDIQNCIKLMENYDEKGEKDKFGMEMVKLGYFLNIKKMLD
jgi:hypothetical protein